jgi:oligopeptide transport system substrate-binding protein
MKPFNQTKGVLAIALLFAVFLSGCVSSANSRYYGQTQPISRNVLRYISGPEPQTLDPQKTSGQPEARILLALYEGLVEYGYKDLQPMPALAESWDINPTIDEFIFHLRQNAKWSNGAPITAKDFVYSLRRGFAPETASPTAELGYFIKYSEAFNGKKVFVKKNGEFLLEKDFVKDAPKTESAPPAPEQSFGPETEFHKFIKSPQRLVLSEDEKSRADEMKDDPKLQAAVEGAEFVPVKAEDIGVEAIDDYTLRITLRQSAPFFLGLLAYQFFRLVPQSAIETHKKNWTRPENIITCGPFRLKSYAPYNYLFMEKDPNYWDAANVHLDGIEFYSVEDSSTMMNLYKAGSIDAFPNHTVPTSWLEKIREYKDEYLNFPENGGSYYSLNMTKPPFNDLKVRQAFHLALDREALSKFRKITKPLYDVTPSGIFPDYDKARAKINEEIRQERGVSPEEWNQRNKFNPEKARKLLTEAGFSVQQSGDEFSCPSFPTDKVNITFNTQESNRIIAEFLQAQWKRNLGVTIPLKNMEFKTYLDAKNKVQYDGMAQTLWSGDYMDPYTFLGLHYGKQNNGGSGFYDKDYDKMLDQANLELDPQKRYEKLARAEFYLMEKMPMMPLTIPATNWMKKPYVKGLLPNPGTLFPWKFVYIERDPSKWDKDVENIMTESDPQVEAQYKALMSTQTERQNNAK